MHLTRDKELPRSKRTKYPSRKRGLTKQTNGALSGARRKNTDSFFQLVTSTGNQGGQKNEW
jgi:hypothetical protein